MDKSNYEKTDRNDYLHVTLTDEDDVYEGLSRLRTVYPNIIKLDYDNTRTKTDQHVTVSEIEESSSPLDLYNALFFYQNNRYLSETEESFMIDLIDRVRGDEE